MARKSTFRYTHDATVYAYGLVPTKPLPDGAVQSLFEANKFWNSLVAIHNKTKDVKAFNDETNRLFKDAYAEAQISGTSKDAIRSNFEEARKKALQHGGCLNFKKFDGTGRWVFRFRSAGKVTDGITVNEFFSQGSRRPLQVAAPIAQGKNRRLKTAIKVAGGRRSDDKIFVDFDLIYHRPLPSDAVVVNAEVVRRRIGDKFKFMLCLTLRMPIQLRHQPRLKSAAGIGIGVRENPEGSIQVAVIATTSGAIEQVSVPQRVLSSLKHVQTLQRKLSDSAAELGKHIRILLRGCIVDCGAHFFLKWVSASDLIPPNRTLAYEQAYKFAGFVMRTPHTLPIEVETALVDWRKTNLRSYREMHNLRAKSLGQRKHYYRNVAARLCAAHSIIGIAEIDLLTFDEAKDADNKTGCKVQSNLFRASVSELRGAIENAARRTGTRIFRLGDAYTSMTCNNCGAIQKTLAATHYWNCASCRAEHERDENAANIVLKKAIQSAEETPIWKPAA